MCRRELGLLALVSWIVPAAILLGCAERPERMTYETVPLPAGGSVETLSLLETSEGYQLVAPARESVFVRPRDGDHWERRSVEWPPRWKQTTSSPLAGVLDTSRSTNFPAHQRFVTHRERIWFITRHGPSHRPVLLVSDDGGRSWSTRQIPDQYSNPSSSGGAPTPLYRMSARVPPRLSDRGAQGLFLVDKQAVWRGQFDTNGEFQGWKQVHLSGVGRLGPEADTDLPTVIRNYLPASQQRPFEILTVFGERLSIYRRSAGGSDFTLVSTLPTVDIELYAPQGTDSLYLLGPSVLYRSRARGEIWERTQFTRTPNTGARHRAAAFVRPADASDRTPPAILVGRANGSIDRSTDGGTTWRRVRPADPDGRGITEFVTTPDDGRLWAATDGTGLLVSTDGGRDWSAPGDDTWSRANRRLRAARPLTVERGPNGELVLGTRSGLFSLTSAPLDGHWLAKHRRATSAVSVASQGSRFIAGTISGALVTMRDGEVKASRPEVDSDRRSPLYQPWHASPTVRDERAILSVTRRPSGSQTFALSRSRGMFVSADAGITWRAKPLNDALGSALEGSAIDNFLASRGPRLYFTSHELDSAAADQIWRSDDDARSWRTVFTAQRSDASHPLFLRQPPGAAADTLLYARGSRLARSDNGGDSWSVRDGPWQNGTIRAYRVGPDRHTVVYNVPRATRVGFAPNDDTTGRERSFTVVWPNGDIRPRSDVRETLTLGQTHYLMTPGSLYVAEVPKGETRLPNAPTIIATLLVVFFVVAGSFWYLRFGIGEPHVT